MNIPNACFANPVAPCNLGATFNAAEPSDFNYVIGHKFGMASPLGPHIVDIVLCGPQEKVVRSNAQRGVTFVAYAQANRNWAVMDNPGRDMCVDTGFSTNTRPNISILPVGALRASPQPAPIRDFHFSPEAPYECRRKSLRSEEFSFIEGPLDQVHFDCVALPEVTGLAGATF